MSSRLARIVPMILAIAGISFSGEDEIVIHPTGATDDIMGDNEEPTAFEASYTSPYGWEDTGVVLRGRAWGEFEQVLVNDNAYISLEFCGKTILTTTEMMPAGSGEYWSMDFEIVYYSISGSEYGAYYASGTYVWGPGDYHNTVYEFFEEPTSMNIECEPTIRIIGDWIAGVQDIDDMRLYSLVVVATD